MIRGIHHVNLLVRDLEQAMQQYQQVLGVDDFVVEHLPSRGVKTARFRAGEAWIVLVEPIAKGEPADVLAEQGEGLFLLSLAVDDLDSACRDVSGRGGSFTAPASRKGIANWQIIDIAPSDVAGARLQLAVDLP